MMSLYPIQGRVNYSKNKMKHLVNENKSNTSGFSYAHAQSCQNGRLSRKYMSRGGWTRSRELNRLRAPPMRLYGELVSLLLKPEYSRLRQGSVALIVINRNIIRTRLNP